jgi:hypothetical protein
MVLSLPPRVRYLLAWDHDLCRTVVAVFLRAVLGFLRARARREGVLDGRGGAVAILQPFGAALNLNVHVHALVLDGVFTQKGEEAVLFHPAAPLGDGEVAAVLEIVRRRIDRLLERRGLTPEDESDRGQDVWMEEAPVLAGIAAASVQGLVALGQRAGARVRRVGDLLDASAGERIGRGHARLGGFDLHAGVVAPAGHRRRLERLCRYALRPPIAEQRLRLTEDGGALLELRHRWSDGTTHVVFEPLELLERLAVLTPRPRVNLVLSYGVLGARARWRAQVVGQHRPVTGGDASVIDERPTPDLHGAPPRGAEAARTWANLMRRSVGFDVLACPRCGGRLRLIALLEQAAVIQRILRHLGLPTEVPPPAPARAPPEPLEHDALAFPDDASGCDAASVPAC